QKYNTVEQDIKMALSKEWSGIQTESHPNY
ncbi:MAG: hypothetical protein K0R23_3665, partial [Lacrimispora sp.]|nr:hypothetical protein [Lacrimispora sp.]